MSTQILINSTENETRIAILEDMRLVELWVERAQQKRIVGDIYKGRVETIKPGLQAAFIDIGQEKSAFLHFDDTTYDPKDFEDTTELGQETFSSDRIRHSVSSSSESSGRPKFRAESIEDMLKEGQEILVQISKESIGDKGPRVTAYLSLAGRYLVLIPQENRIGISRKIEDQSERRRLRKTVSEMMPCGFGAIIRTAAEGKEKKDFRNDLKILLQHWRQIRKKAKKTFAPALIYREVEITIGMLRDILNEKVESIIVDSKKTYKEILDYLKTIFPEMRSRVLLYQEEIPLFEAYEIEEQIEKALGRKVWLKKGGYITIDQTEALVAIDVNTGRYTGKRNPEETVLKTNLTACREIARQLRLRDIGGIIVIDFIDMEKEENKNKVMTELKNMLKDDRARPKVLEISPLGIVEMTRKRVRPSLWHAFSEDCPFCQGTGRVLSKLTMTMQIERWFGKFGAQLKGKELEIRVHPSLGNYLREENSEFVNQLCKDWRLKIEIQDDHSLSLEEFHVYFAETNFEVDKTK
ncbi:MAG: Rne/Rng family ribonuclease [Candidatus Edwardsbacteria bacterium]